MRALAGVARLAVGLAASLATSKDGPGRLVLGLFRADSHPAPPGLPSLPLGTPPDLPRSASGALAPGERAGTAAAALLAAVGSLLVSGRHRRARP